MYKHTMRKASKFFPSRDLAMTLYDSWIKAHTARLAFVAPTCEKQASGMKEVSTEIQIKNQALIKQPPRTLSQVGLVSEIIVLLRFQNFLDPDQQIR
jgi:hypothetical protein